MKLNLVSGSELKRELNIKIRDLNGTIGIINGRINKIEESIKTILEYQRRTYLPSYKSELLKEDIKGILIKQKEKKQRKK